MKKSISPGVIVLILAIVVIIVGLVYMKGGSGGAKESDIMQAIKNQSGQGDGKTPMPNIPIPKK